VIDLTVVPEALERAVKRAREKRIIIPTVKQQKDPGRIPEAIVSRLKNIGLWDIAGIMSRWHTGAGLAMSISWNFPKR